MTYPMPASSVGELLDALAGIAHVEGGQLVIDDDRPSASAASTSAVWSATFSEEHPDVIEVARWLIWEASQLLGSPSASIHELYMARGRGEVSGFTVPAVNIRTQVFDMAGAMCRAAESIDAGTIIFELARSEQEYTYQRPGEYITSVLAGCIGAGWQGPVFVQGDHYQFNAKKYAADPEATTEAITAPDPRGDRRRLRQHRHRLVDAGRSGAADRRSSSSARTTSARRRCRRSSARSSRPTRRSASAARSARSASRTRPRRSCAPTSTAIATTLRELAGRRAGPFQGQRPDRHHRTAACRCPAAAWRRSRSTSGRSSDCRRWPASTAWPAPSSTAPRRCPTSCSTASRRSRRPRSTSRPASRTCSTSTRRSRATCWPRSRAGAIANTADERKDGESDDQFLYKTRKKALGPYKRQLWELPGKDEIIAGQESKLRYLFEQLAIAGTRELVERYVNPAKRSMPAPEALLALEAAERFSG